MTPSVILIFTGTGFPFSSVGAEIQYVCSTEDISVKSTVCAKYLPGHFLNHDRYTMRLSSIAGPYAAQ